MYIKKGGVGGRRDKERRRGGFICIIKKRVVWVAER